MTFAVSAELAALVAHVQEFCTTPPNWAPIAGEQCTLDEVDEFTEILKAKRLLITWLEVDFARDAARLDAIYPYGDARLMHPSPVALMRDFCHMTGHAASTAVEIGEEMTTTIPRTVEAVRAGRIGLAHLGLMANTAQMVERGSDRPGTPRPGSFDETALLASAERLSVQRFRSACNHVLHAKRREDFLMAQIENRETRTLRLERCAAGLQLTGSFDAEGAALIRTALEPFARPSGADDDREPDRRNADALLELCAAALDAGSVPSRGSQRPHLQVTATLETLLGLTGAPAGELEHGDLIATDTVQRFACDATITRVLVDAQSMVIDVGRSQRVVHGATRRALNVRDRGCRWPGCERSISYSQAHHIEHWTRHGVTDLVNLVLLCHRHHWKVHEGGWQFFRNAEDEVMVIPPVPDRERPTWGLESVWRYGGSGNTIEQHQRLYGAGDVAPVTPQPLA